MKHHGCPEGMNPPPPSFDEELSEDWGLWVLEHGFPEFPPVLMRGQSVPVARYVGRDLASVMYLEWHWGNDDPSEDSVDTMFTTYFRTGDGWKSAGDRGGSSWPDDAFQSVVVPHCVIADLHHGVGDVGTAMGMVTSEAAFLEVRQNGDTHTSRIVAPMNLITVTVKADVRATVRVLDHEGHELLVKDFSGHW